MNIIQNENEFWKLYAAETTTPEKQIDPVPIDALEYEVKDMAILTIEEATQFEKSLQKVEREGKVFWEEQQISKKLNHVKNSIDLAWGGYDAATLAKKLGGYGVKCRTIVRNGVQYIVFYDYKKSLKTLLPGSIYKANNPKVTSLGFGALGLARNLKSNVIVTVLWCGGVEGVGVALSDKKGMGDWLGEVGVSIAVTVSASILAAGTIVLSGGTTVLGTGLLFTGTTVTYGSGLQYIIDSLGISTRAKLAIKNNWDEYWHEQLEATESYNLEDYEDD
jgi:hypothetical protein